MREAYLVESPFIDFQDLSSVSAPLAATLVTGLSNRELSPLEPEALLIDSLEQPATPSKLFLDSLLFLRSSTSEQWSGREGRRRDGNGWESLENLAIGRHQRNLQILSKGHELTVIGGTTRPIG